jgi:hypothetical protein
MRILNLYDILQKVLNESVSPENVVDAINNKTQVIIKYSDEKNRAPEKRLIEPYVYGISRAGNSVFRAYQYEGDTFRGIPKWKLFRLDRVTDWQPTDNHFNAQPRERGWNAEAYNEHGDNSMTTVLNQVSLDYDETSDNPYEKGSDLYNIRKRTDAMKRSKPLNINALMPNKGGAVKNDVTSSIEQETGNELDGEQQEKQIPTNAKPDMNSQSFKDMLAKNLELTRREKERRGFSLNKGKNQRGPVMDDGYVNGQERTDFGNKLNKKLNNRKY